MNSRPNDLPDYDAPPLDEVALSVQFQPIKDLQSPQIGLLWAKYRNRFPKTEQHPPLETMMEHFGPTESPSIKFEFSSSHPTNRCWFLNEDSTELIQIQQDRFIHNWRKVSDGAEYPRYKHIRGQFESELEIFCEFLKSEDLGELLPNQCEITYTNAITTEQNIPHGQVNAVFAPISMDYSDNFLGEPENMRVAAQYIFKNSADEPMGRLHILLKPAFRVSDNQPIFILNITARGAPQGKEKADILNFFDIGREWIVRGFTSITTPDMHKYWRRKDGAKHSDS